ncbi:MAG: serine hydrolase [Candidatus Aminicenantes bacterium]|nr:serine hydrolase [Candidatus Aminicenantes bacterium]
MKDIETYIYALMEKGSIPGISLLVGKGEEILFKKQYGFKSLLPQKEILEENTLYDLASLTKPLVTALLTLYLLEKEKGLNLETPIKKIFPDLPFDIRLVHLLTHSSGLPAWYPFYLYTDAQNPGYFPQMKSLQLESRPGEKVNYSCMGYILLYYIIEKVSAMPFKELAQKIIIEPLGLTDTFLSLPENLKPLAAPTEKGNLFEKQMALATPRHKAVADRFQWREDVIRGDTHDCNSHYLGGSAGNAGLFSTCEDLFKMKREFFPAGATILTPESTQLFWKNFTPFDILHRTIGFSRNSSLSITSAGKALSRRAIGHTGFTGTSLWLDPKTNYSFIILTNRIHPSVANINFNKIRGKLHKIIASTSQGPF